MDKLLDELVNAVADRVIVKLSDQNSNWLNTINYKVDVKNIQGFNEAVQQIADRAAEDVLDNSNLRNLAEEAAEETLKNASFEINVSF